MIKRIIFSLTILSFIASKDINATSIDSVDVNKLIPLDWKAISGAEKVLSFVKESELTKRTKSKSDEAKVLYNKGVTLMNKGNYSEAVDQFQQAMKKYKRAKLNDDALNYIRTNTALSYASIGGKDNKAAAKQQLSMVTKEVYKEQEWLYNLAVAHYHAGNEKEAISLLSLAIRKNEFYFQAYVTLAEIHKRNKNSQKEAVKVKERLTKAVQKQKRKEEREAENQLGNPTDNKKSIDERAIKKPDPTKLRVVKKDDILQFNKTDKSTEKAMMKYIQEGIKEYDEGVKKIARKKWSEGIDHLKTSEKKLKRGKISEDALSFVRGNLAIAYFALVESTGSKKGISQGKKALRLLTNKIYKNKDASAQYQWTYNLGVVYYTLASTSTRRNKETTTSRDSKKESIRLLKMAIKQERLFLPAYQNLMYIYREMREEDKMKKVYKAYEKARRDLFKSLSKEDQRVLGGHKYIFRINVGEFGEFDTPVRLFDEKNVITIPISEEKTAYLAGLFYNLDKATEYLEKLKKKGYNQAYIIAYRDDGEVLEF